MLVIWSRKERFTLGRVGMGLGTEGMDPCAISSEIHSFLSHRELLLSLPAPYAPAMASQECLKILCVTRACKGQTRRTCGGKL